MSAADRRPAESERADDGEARREQRAGARRVHPTSVLVFTVGAALTLGLTIASVVSISSGNQRYLAQQARQVDSAVQATVTALQQPLIAAANVASNGTSASFRAYAETVTGEGNTFTSMSLWHVVARHATLEAVVGSAPLLLKSPEGGSTFISSVPRSTQLTVLGIISGKVRTLGYAERLPRSTDGVVVYAESALPANPFIAPVAPSPFAGLDFALYFGRVTSARTLMLSTIALPPSGRSTEAVVPFGSAQVTVVSALVGRPAGVLPHWVPFAVAAAGLALAALAAAFAERLVRRREAAESVAEVRGAETETQRGIAQTLQHALLPEEHPTFPGVEMATRYVAGVEHLEVGGDWFDAIALDGHRLFLTVGDVSGRGLAAATVMGSLRHAIRAYAIQGDAPAEVLRKLSGLVNVGRDGCFATVICVLLDVTTGKVTVASAGHTPALVVDARGRRFVDAPPNTPVGVQGPRPPASIEFELAPEALLVAYTDGLVERRGQSLDDGLDALRDAAIDWDAPVADVLAGVVATMLPEGAGDDVAILAVRRLALTGAAAPDGLTFVPRAKRTFGRDAVEVAAARTFAVDALPEASEDARAAVALLVSELATNATQHARTPFEVAVAVDESGRRVRVEIGDFAGGEPTPRSPGPSESRGRGLGILEATADTWGIESHDEAPGKTVWFELDLGPSTAAPPSPARAATRPGSRGGDGLEPDRQG